MQAKVSYTPEGEKECVPGQLAANPSLRAAGDRFAAPFGSLWATEGRHDSGASMQHVCNMGPFPKPPMPLKNKKDLDFSRSFTGSPKGNRTPVNAVRGRRPNR